MASIAWTDAQGAATLTNGKSGAASRFAQWTPVDGFDGDARQGPGMNAPAAFVLREHVGARFALPFVPAGSLGLVVRLKRHLERGGGSCVVTTDDAASRVYPTCFLYPASTVTWELTDPAEQEFTVSLTVADRQASPSPMLCVY